MNLEVVKLSRLSDQTAKVAKGFACSALILVQQLPPGVFFSCHVRVVQRPPYFLQNSNRNNRPTIKKRNNSPGLACIPPCLGCHQQRGEIWRTPGCSGYIQGHLRWWYKITLHCRASSRDLIGISIFYFFFFTSIVTVVLIHCELNTYS